MVIGLAPQDGKGRVDLFRGITRLAQMIREQTFFEVAVARAVGPVAQVAVFHLVTEKFDDPFLGVVFGLTDAHGDRPRTLSEPRFIG